MKIIKTKFKGLLILKQNNYKDKRGNLRVTYSKKKFKKDFIYEYCTVSKKNVLRDFHFQTKSIQSKFVNVVKGKILDVVIDLRKNSKTFGKVFKIILSQENALGLFIPGGFAHAYYSYEKENVIYYKLDNYYSPRYESGIFYNDKKIRVKWPRKKMLISKKDRKLKSFEEFKRKFKSL